MPSLYSDLKDSVFSGPHLFSTGNGQDKVDFSSQYATITGALENGVGRYVLRSIIRCSFFIQLVEPPSGAATYAVRWSDRLDHHNDDPRKASFEDCLDIFRTLLNDLGQQIGDSDKRELLKLFSEENLVAYELPIDYIERRFKGEQIHSPDNVEWVWSQVPERTVRLRKRIYQEQHDHSDFFEGVRKKLKRKAHKTDRVNTGRYKTNREFRWEAHPNSVHFAKRTDCQEVEWVLINQLCYFKGFPSDFRSSLEEDNVISFHSISDPALDTFDDKVMRCPITLEPLSFEDIEEELSDTDQGSSAFHVGHMHPLKADEDNDKSGHTAENISWISDKGNEIQGQYSVDETRELFFSMMDRYKDTGAFD
ncbi:hypothetical protein [Salinibacter ruber]|uniref:hypothetical protein n=1 Tax=Salinibacter ruber TaxID=146919 RepID=UPI0013C2E1EE|nr:hypothetical protein [Salinibacter ruber]